jgi:hypothetical protein
MVVMVSVIFGSYKKGAVEVLSFGVGLNFLPLRLKQGKLTRS